MEIKVLIVGPMCVGKTQLLKQYIIHQFNANYCQTKTALIAKKVVDNVTLCFWDIPGSKQYMQR